MDKEEVTENTEEMGNEEMSPEPEAEEAAPEAAAEAPAEPEAEETEEVAPEPEAEEAAPEPEAEEVAPEPEAEEAAPEPEAEEAAPEPEAEEAAPEPEDEEPMESFEELFEKSLKVLEEGEVVKGSVVEVTDDFVTVDIGYKSEGLISIQEFTDEEGQLTVDVGDEVDVLLERREDEDGTIILSKEKAAKIKVWDDISSVFQDDGVISGKIVAKVKGGLSVDIGVTAFLPGSQVDLRPVRNLESHIGETYDFKILKYNKRRRNVVLSRRAILEKEREALKSETLAKLTEGAVLEGVVKNITDYGVFVDLGGIDGLLHITDMSWGRIGHPSEMFKVGDDIEVMVLSFNPENERVSLGLKQLTEDPWNSVDERYFVSERVKGRVVSLTNYGAFVELEKGIEGLVHVSEMSWTKKITHPSKVVAVDDMVEVVVLGIDKAAKRISLGMKQVEPNPWDIIADKYPLGSVVEGKVKNITDFGLFVGVDEGIDGLVHISDISWTKRIKHPGEIFKKGEDVKAVVLKIDKENERFSLGIKQLETDPWEEIAIRYPVGSVIEGTVTNITDFGIFVEIEEGIEGLVHISEIPQDKGKSSMEEFHEGDRVKAKVVNIGKKERKIGLSIKKAMEAEERSYYSYTGQAREATSNLGELLKEAAVAVKPEEPAAEDTAAEAEAAPEPEAEAEEAAAEPEAEPEAEAEEAAAEPEAEPEPEAEEAAAEPEAEPEAEAEEAAAEPEAEPEAEAEEAAAEPEAEPEAEAEEAAAEPVAEEAPEEPEKEEG